MSEQRACYEVVVKWKEKIPRVTPQVCLPHEKRLRAVGVTSQLAITLLSAAALVTLPTGLVTPDTGRVPCKYDLRPHTVADDDLHLLDKGQVWRSDLVWRCVIKDHFLMCRDKCVECVS